jgi:serine/threonine protein kinase
VPAAGEVLGGRYRLERVLGVGGMGEVWLAAHVELGSPVAVKLMSPALLRDETARIRFRREARATARLRGPHVVAVHDFGEDDGVPYLVMEYLVGGTLQERVANRRLELPEAALFADHACRGLALAHAHDVVHRDVKPSNLFIAEVAGQSVLKIVDFGIARAVLDEQDGSVTRSGVIVGSPAFMSPEQASGEPATAASDVWALGSVLYWMVTGREPFAGRMLSETLHRVRTAQFTPPGDIAPQLPSELDAFFAKAFNLEPARRFQSADELAVAFRAALSGDGESPKSGPGVGHFGSRTNTPRRRGLRWAVLVLAATSLLVALVAVDFRPAPAPAASAAVESRLLARSEPLVVTSPAVVVPAPIVSASDARETKVEPRERVRVTAQAQPSVALTPKGDFDIRASGRREALDPVFGIPLKPPRRGTAGVDGSSGSELGVARHE